MTIEQKKISLISWISNLQDEDVIDQIAEIQKASLNDLPNAVVQMLKMAKNEPKENLVEHTGVKDILKVT